MSEVIDRIKAMSDEEFEELLTTVLSNEPEIAKIFAEKLDKKENPPSQKELLDKFGNYLFEAKESYERYAEYEPRVSELEYLGFNDEDMELHSLRSTMNEYYDDYKRNYDKSNEIYNKLKELYPDDGELEDTLEYLIEEYGI